MQTDSVITRLLEGNKRDILIKLNISNQKHLHKHRAREKKDLYALGSIRTKLSITLDK